MEGKRRHLTLDASCKFCDHPSETTVHVLRDCTRAKVVWYRLIPDAERGSFFQIELHDWLGRNLTRGLGRYNAREWAILFEITLSLL